MEPTGRPRFLNFLKRSEYCSLIASGLTPAQAARHVGCDLKTVRREAKRDPDFRSQLNTARRSAAVDPIKLVRQAAGSHWRAAAWLLERTEPDKFGPRSAKSCRPEQVEDLVATLVEEAISLCGGDEKAQARAYQRLHQKAEEGLNTLFPGGRPTRRSRVATPLTDDLRFRLEVGLIRPADEPTEGRATAPSPQGSQPQPRSEQRSQASPLRKDSPASKADICPSEPKEKRDKTPSPFVPLFARELARKLQESLPPDGQKPDLLSPKIESQKTDKTPPKAG
jgi:hypothetical protein